MKRIGVDLGGTKIEAVVLADDGAEHWRRRVATPSGDYRATVQAVAALVHEAQTVAGADATVGVGTPGAVTALGAMKNCNSTCLNGQPLPADLRAAIGRPVAIANDADCLALSEATDGAGAGAAVVFAAILGTGVGAGVVVNGRLLQGPNRTAGEWGHNPLPWADETDRPAPRCWCGLEGCLETWLSGPALARDHAARGGAAVDAAQVATLAAAGDPAAAATLERHASRLARGLAAVINVLDPDVIVLGGGVSRIDGLYERVPVLWQRWVFGAAVDGPVRTRLVPALHGDASGVRGAAWLGRQAD
ncbi:MAG: ROK family protein [Rubrivivax sp.]|nr:ROK family protein [Rubrivivax sp.]